MDPAHAFDLKKIDLDVADLPRGIYYLHLGFGSKKDNQIEKKEKDIVFESSSLYRITIKLLLIL